MRCRVWAVLVLVLLLACPCAAQKAVPEVAKTAAKADKSKPEKKKEKLDAQHRFLFYGKIHSVFVNQNVRGADLGSPQDPLDDNLSAIPIVNGNGLSQLGVFGVNAYISPSLRAGAELDSYLSSGSTAVNIYWGTSAPWLVNVWTALGSPSTTDNLSSPASPTLLRLVPDNFWLSHRETDSRLTVGTFHTNYVGSYLLAGRVNPGFYGGSILPLYGMDLRASAGDFKLEGLYTRQPDATAYKTSSIGGALRWELGDHKSALTLNGIVTRNDNPPGLPVALAALQLLPNPSNFGPDGILGVWQGLNGLPTTKVGPQAQTSLGGDLELVLYKRLGLVLHAEFAATRYTPDTSGIVFDTTVGGTMSRVGLAMEPVPGLSARLGFLRVDPTYDPFVINVPTQPGVALYRSVTNVPTTTGQLHDTSVYPNNRQGLSARLEYVTPSRATKLTLSYDDYRQVAPTSIEQVLKVGNIEADFPPLLLSDTELGRIPSAEATLTHSWKWANLWVKLSYKRTDMLRNGDEIEAVDISQTTWRVQVKRPLNDIVALHAGYSQVDWKGAYGFIPVGATERIPSFGFDLALGKRHSVTLDYQIIRFSDPFLGTSTANQLRVEMKNEF